MADNDRSKGRDDREQAWDRVGSAMGAAGEVATSIGRRNIDVWNAVAANVRKRNYTADDMAADAARAMTAAMDSVRDLWTVLTTPPFGPTQQAPSVETRTLFFQPPAGGGDPPRYVVTGLVPSIPLPGDIAPATPEVSIRVTGPDQDTVKELERCITGVATTDGQLELGTQDVGTLKEGLYQGIVYVDADSQPRLVAQLLIAVEPARPGSPAPAGDT